MAHYEFVHLERDCNLAFAKNALLDVTAQKESVLSVDWEGLVQTTTLPVARVE